MKKCHHKGLTLKGGPGVLLSKFDWGPGVPFLNFRRVPGPTFKHCGGPWSRSLGSWGLGPTFTPCQHGKIKGWKR